MGVRETEGGKVLRCGKPRENITLGRNSNQQCVMLKGSEGIGYRIHKELIESEHVSRFNHLVQVTDAKQHNEKRCVLCLMEARRSGAQLGGKDMCRCVEINHGDQNTEVQKG